MKTAGTINSAADDQDSVCCLLPGVDFSRCYWIHLSNKMENNAAKVNVVTPQTSARQCFVSDQLTNICHGELTFSQTQWNKMVLETDVFYDGTKPEL